MKESLDKVVIIIPSLNPNEQIITLVENLKVHGFQHIIVINDGSVTECSPYFQLLEKEHHCKVLKHAVNLGKGRALKDAFNYILTIGGGYTRSCYC